VLKALIITISARSSLGRISGAADYYIIAEARLFFFIRRGIHFFAHRHLGFFQVPSLT
jgi:hypothetical protein